MGKRLVCALLTGTLAIGLMSCGSSTSGKNEIERNTYEMPTETEESEIFVNAIEGISDDFIRGVDVSSVLAEENSGVVYYNEAGEEQDIFQTLAEAGVNYARFRVWNDPYDSDGNGYGGGNNDVATAITLGQRATAQSMKVLIDFHYSDFWADPTKQFSPKAWEDMSVEEKSEALYTFTKESLTEIVDAGVDVGMVQIGNEINKGMSGETKYSDVCTLLASGSKAVREISEEYGTDIKIVIHYTDIHNKGEVEGLADTLDENDVDYDILGLSYYAYWHGGLENIDRVASYVQGAYGKDLMIVETAYAYTTEDSDGASNSYDGVEDAVEGYPISVQGQARMVRDVCAAAVRNNMLGVFYWEPAWITVGSGSNNSSLWEKYGSGWASSYAGDYDPNDAGKYYGGSSWDNQAMFDSTGHPLASLNVWKYLKYGSTAELAIEDVLSEDIVVNVGEELVLPEKVTVLYNDSSEKAVSVTWKESDVAAIDTNVDGNYSVTGTTEDGATFTIDVAVKLINYVVNGSFEDEDRSMWTITSEGTDPTDYQDKSDDAYDGNIALHWWSGSADMDFTLSQEITDLPAGTYMMSLFSQGGDADDSAEMEPFVRVGDTEYNTSFTVTTWADWKNPVVDGIEVNEGDTVTVGIHIKTNVNSWGTVDDFVLNKVK